MFLESDVRRWWSEGVKRGARHLLVVSDQAVYLLPGEDIETAVKRDVAAVEWDFQAVYRCDLSLDEQFKSGYRFHV